jgi:uncharacterized membrane protein
MHDCTIFPFTSKDRNGCPVLSGMRNPNMKNLKFKFPVFIVSMSAFFSFMVSLPVISGETVPPFRMNVYPKYFELPSGKDTVMELTLENSGKNSLNSLTFDVRPDSGLRISCDPPSILLLNAGESVKIKLTAHPQRTIFQKTLKVSFTVRSDPYQLEETLEFAVSAPEGMWMKTGLFLAACMLIIFIVIFFHTNRDNQPHQEEDHDPAGA